MLIFFFTSCFYCCWRKAPRTAANTRNEKKGVAALDATGVGALLEQIMALSQLRLPTVPTLTRPELPPSQTPLTLKQLHTTEFSQLHVTVRA